MPIIGSKRWHSSDFFLKVARGSMTGYTGYNGFGRNVDCDPKASATAVVAGRDIWDGGIAGATMWMPPTAARIHAIASTSSTDGSSGTGALDCVIYGLDSDYKLQSETITFGADATTPVNTVNAYTMIHRMHSNFSGSSGRNIGDITATAATDSTVTCKITADNNESLSAIYQIPAGKTGYLYDIYGSIHRAGAAATYCDFALMLQQFGHGWIEHNAFDCATDGTCFMELQFQIPVALEAKSYLKMVADPNKVAQDVSSGFDMILVDD